MKNALEFAGVTGLWMLGMVTVYPETWPVCWLVALALVAACLIVAYGYEAWQQSKNGDPHYAKIALWGIALTVASLSISAWRLEDGETFLLGLLGVYVFVVGAFLYNERRKRIAK
jgi:hypothetical protein